MQREAEGELHVMQREAEGELHAHLLAGAATNNVRRLHEALRNGVPVDTPDGNGSCALHHAASNGHADAVECLLEHRANPAACDRNGATALHHACATKSEAAAARLLQDLAVKVNQADGGGVTALMSSALNGDLNLVKRLLNCKADPDAVDLDGGTALMRAASHGHGGICSLLLESKAAPDAQDVDGDSALHTATRFGHVDVVSLLLRFGAHPGLLDARDMSPADVATSNGHDGCRQLLQAAEADAANFAQAARLKDELQSHTLDVYERIRAEAGPQSERSDGKDDDGSASSGFNEGSMLHAAQVVAPVDISGDGGVLKRVLRPGRPGGLQPSLGCTARCRYTVMLATNGDGSGPGAVVTRSEMPCTEIVLEQPRAAALVAAQPRALHQALGTMCPGEQAEFQCRAEYVYGADGDATIGVPAASLCRLLVELLDYTWSGAPAEGRLDEAIRIKSLGNEAFKEGRFEGARANFERGAHVVGEAGVASVRGREPEALTLRVTCLSNLALCHLRLRQWEAAEAAADAALALEPAHAKAQYRRGVARMERGDSQKALADLRCAVRAEPQSREVRTAYERCKDLVADGGQREKAFGDKLTQALDGSYRQTSETSEEESGMSSNDEAAAGAKAALDESGDGGRSHLENERTIADARLDNNEGNLVLDADEGRLKLRSMEEMGGKGRGYTWGQSETELVVRIPVLEGTRGQDVDFSLTSTTLRLSIVGVGTVLDGTLFAPILADESYFQMEESSPANGSTTTVSTSVAGGLCVMVSLVKTTPTKAKQHWPCIVLGEPRIAVEEFGEPVIAINEDSKDDIQRYLRIMEDAEVGKLPDG